MSDVTSRRRRRSRIVAAAATALISAAPAAAETVSSLSISPAAPTWRDRVEVVLAGTIPGDCIPIVAPADAVRLGPDTYRIDVLLATACPPLEHPTSIPFETRSELHALEPGSYTLRVVDAGGAPFAQLSFLVYEVGDAAIELPAISTANHPGSVRLTWLAGAGTPAASVELDGSVVEVHVSSPSSLSPLTQLASLDVPLPLLAVGRHELRVFLPSLPPLLPPRLVRAELHVLRPAACVPDEQTLCLHDGRFRVSATWRDFAGRTGAAHPAPLAGNEGSGLLWFFGPDNTELTVKVLDACVFSQHWWTFVSSSSTVQYTLTVADTATGRTRTYGNPLGQVPRLVADTAAFACP